MCQHKAPHREWLPALRHLGHDGDRRYPEPPTLFDDYAGRGKAEHDQDMTIAKTMNAIDLKLTPPADPDRRGTPGLGRLLRAPKRRISGRQSPGQRTSSAGNISATCTITSAASRPSTRASAACSSFLDEAGSPGNTIVVYTSDQGFYLGEHGWFDKRWIFEESLRTPLLVRWPGVVKPGSTNASLVSNIDFAETFLEAAGLPIPAEMQGRSLVPLLKGETPPDWRKSFYYQYFEYPAPHHVRPHYGVVTSRYKLVRFDSPDVDEWELFDLEQDPLELRNVYPEPAYAAHRQGPEARARSPARWS